MLAPAGSLMKRYGGYDVTDSETPGSERRSVLYQWANFVNLLQFYEYVNN